MFLSLHIVQFILSLVLAMPVRVWFLSPVHNSLITDSLVTLSFYVLEAHASSDLEF